MAEQKTHTFIVNDDSILNSFGFRVMTAGIDIKHYKKNPIVMWFHKRSYKYDGRLSDEVLPIGKAVKLWKEGGKLYADIVFDEDDEFAVKVEKKLDGGFLNMCSPGLEPVTISDAPNYLLPGQTRSTVVKSRLEEISIVDRGANDNALRLYKDGNRIELSAIAENEIVPKIHKNTKTMELKQQLAGILGLSSDAADGSFIEAVKALKDASSYKGKFETLSKEVERRNEADIKALVEANVDKKFTADKKETFIGLGKSSGISALRNLLEGMPDIQKRPGDGLNGSQQQVTDNGGYKTFAELAKKGTDEVLKFSRENREKFIELYKAEYGVEPSFAE